MGRTTRLMLLFAAAVAACAGDSWAAGAAKGAVVATVAVPADTEVHLSLDTLITSKSAHPGDQFFLHVTEAVQVGGKVVIPVGAKGEGQIVHAQKAGFFGKAGELILTVRSVEVDGHVIRMHGMEPRTGKDRTETSEAVSTVLGPFAGFVRGGHIKLPPGTEITTYIVGDTGKKTVQLPVQPSAGKPASPTSSTTAGSKQ